MEQKTWRILSVDDDPEKQDEIKRILSGRMDDIKFEFKMVNSFDEGISQIKEAVFDLVFLDVHEASDPEPMDNPSAEDQRGEELLNVIKAVRFVPVIFYTGYAAKVKYLETPFVRILGKGSTPTEIRECVKYILSTGLLELSRYIEEQSRSYMWDSLSTVTFDELTEIRPKDISLLLARNLARNLSQEAVKTIVGEDNGNINPLEMYLYPPDASSCNPADILKSDSGSYWMVLTPACDFEQSKVENVLMVRIIPLIEHPFYLAWLEEKTKYDLLDESEQVVKDNKKPLNVAKDKVRRLVKGQSGERFKFLPSTFFLQDSIVDFQETRHFPISSSNGFQVICSLDTPYREEMLHLFSKYYGRIGTPDYDVGALWNEIEEIFNE